jgi:hypothetical protein
MDTLIRVSMNVEVIKVTLYALFIIVPLVFVGLAFLRTVRDHALKPLRSGDRRARRPSLDWEVASAKSRHFHAHIGTGTA